MEAKQYEDSKKVRGITPDGDHVYYVAHKEVDKLKFDLTHNAKFNENGTNPKNLKVPEPVMHFHNPNIKNMIAPRFIR